MTNKKIALPTKSQILGKVMNTQRTSLFFFVQCSDGVKRACHTKTRGVISLKKGELLLVEPIRQEENRCWYIHKYSPEEVEMLEKRGYLNFESPERGSPE